MDGVAACAGAPAATDARKIKKAITVFLMSAKLMIFPNSAIKTKENPKCNANLQIIIKVCYLLVASTFPHQWPACQPTALLTALRSINTAYALLKKSLSVNYLPTVFCKTLQPVNCFSCCLLANLPVCLLRGKRIRHFLALAVKILLPGHVKGGFLALRVTETPVNERLKVRKQAQKSFFFVL